MLIAAASKMCIDLQPKIHCEWVSGVQDRMKIIVKGCKKHAQISDQEKPLAPFLPAGCGVSFSPCNKIVVCRERGMEGGVRRVKCKQSPEEYNPNKQQTGTSSEP